MTKAEAPAEWAHALAPTPDDLALAGRLLRDTVADRLRTPDWSSVAALLEREFGHAGATA